MREFYATLAVPNRKEGNFKQQDQYFPPTYDKGDLLCSQTEDIPRWPYKSYDIYFVYPGNAISLLWQHWTILLFICKCLDRSTSSDLGGVVGIYVLKRGDEFYITLESGINMRLTERAQQGVKDDWNRRPTQIPKTQPMAAVQPRTKQLAVHIRLSPGLTQDPGHLFQTFSLV